MIFASLLGGVGLKGLIWVSSDTILILDSRQWKPARATITKSKIEVSSSRHGDKYSVGVEYTFNVDGRSFIGNRFEIPARWSGDEAEVREQQSFYVPSAPSVIYFDPADPRRSVVRFPEMNYWFTFGLGSFSVAFLVLAGYQFLLAIRRPAEPYHRQ